MSASASASASASSSSSSSLSPPRSRFRCRVRNAAQLVVIHYDPARDAVAAVGDAPTPPARLKCTEAEMNRVDVLDDAGLIVGHDGRIVAVGTEANLQRAYPDETSEWYEVAVDARGKVVLPGLCDAHTHIVWAGDRCHEFALKLAGATYMDVHKAGGGIGSTVRACHAASEDELLDLLLPRLRRCLRNGTTLLEAKSGYGQTLATEAKMLRVIERAKTVQPIELVATYCGAHTVPPGSTASATTDDIIHVQLPELVRMRERGEIVPEMIDVFCEKGVYEVDDTRRILAAGQAAGFALNFHAEELVHLGGAELGAELGARAISHLEHVSETAMRAMAERRVIGVLLPSTAYVLRLTPPPARAMIAHGVPIALGSDLCPNAHCTSLPMIMNLACVHMRLTMNEALNAATTNAACSMGRGATHGTLEPGKFGDMIVLDAPSWQHLIYQMVDPPIVHVMKHGRIVV